MQRALALFLSVSFAALVWGKPVTVRPDGELRACSWAAEVQVLRVNGASIRVRITSDPKFIYRGFHLIDRTVDVQPSAFGPRTCVLAMREHARKQARLLVVVRPGNQLILIGAPQDEAGKRTYAMSSWCDFNACFIRPQDPAFGKTKGDKFSMTRTETARMFKVERSKFYSEVFAAIFAAPAAVDQKTIAGLITALSSDSFLARERAQRLLLKSGAASLPLLEKAYLQAGDIEQRFRLRQVITKLEQDTSLFRFVKDVRNAQGVDGLAMLILETFDSVTSKDIRYQCAKRLRQLGSQAEPPVHFSNKAPSQEVISKWRKRIAAKK